jgi:hypothetical protein
MTKDDFVLRQTVAKREENKVSIILLVVLFGGLIGLGSLAPWMDHHRSVVSIQVAYGVSIFGFMIGNMIFLVWGIRRRARQYGHNCPVCGKPLVGFAAQIAIASGNCGHCGQPVFDG